ncbi:GrpB domain, predicted nucleotidyltransferase, UPF0157 family [Lentibacillus halodurans]|uniref:GrpB domain, predicted nucleotidyltransferase, UPF0157 family n=2 Tax=Lentibacillus halodurans TaxID=237679 RepID=A0A1I0ZXC6_9BACI|nr:GrpB domain, predicted nucleotidyltransferase, UPF0157 family [Lentibacillus halodurans]
MKKADPKRLKEETFQVFLNEEQELRLWVTSISFTTIHGEGIFLLGVHKGQVKIAGHSTQWKDLFLEEKQLLLEMIGESVVDIQHAIKNISAKPIIDMLVGMKSLEDVDLFDRKRLAEEDIYRLKVVLDGKVVFAKFSDLKNLTKTHIIHVVEYKGDWWNQHLFSLDFSNENPDAVREYEALKIELAN